MSLHIRPALEADAATIVTLIQALAAYEREPDAVEVTASDLAAQLASPSPPFACLLALWHGEVCGFALYFQSYSTWRGRPGLYLEDLFVTPERRGLGIGKALLCRLAALAVARGYARMEWAVLNWNQPAIDFYTALGATPQNEWTRYRLCDAPLQRLAMLDAAAFGAGAGGPARR